MNRKIIAFGGALLASICLSAAASAHHEELSESCISAAHEQGGIDVVGLVPAHAVDFTFNIIARDEEALVMRDEVRRLIHEIFDELDIGHDGVLNPTVMLVHDGTGRYRDSMWC